MIQPELQLFVRQMEAFNIAVGLSKSVARVFAYLTVCQPTRQTADEIKQNLTISTGSVSEALAMLRSIELIERVKTAGDRRFYYELDPDGWKRATIRKFRMLDVGIDLAASGLKVAPNDPRLTSMYTMYSTFSREFADFAKRLE